MAAPRAVWGIDIGQCALKAVRIRAVGDKVEALSHEYIEHPKILSQPEADRAGLVAKALEEFLSRHDLRQDHVVVGVPGQHTLSRFTKLPPIDKKNRNKIPEIVRYEANQQIPFDMDEVIWDYQTFTSETEEVEVGIFAMRRELVGEQLQPFVAAGIEPVVVQSAPLAVYNALHYDRQFGDNAVLVLDIGAQNTDLIVAEPTSLWTRNIPLGGSNFTEALLKTFKVSFAKAESLKRGATSSKYARQIFQAMRPVFADLVAEIQRSMGFYSSTHRGVRIAKVIGVGNAFELPGLQKFLQSNLGLEVSRPTKYNMLSVASAENAQKLVERLPSYTVAYGLALQGLGLTHITSNLLPSEIAKAIVWRKKTPWFWAAAACLAVAAAMVWGRYFLDAGALADVAEASTSPPAMTAERALELVKGTGPGEAQQPLNYAREVIALANTLRAECDALESRGAPYLQKIDRIKDVQADKTLWLQILQEIHNALPTPQNTLEKALKDGTDAYVQFAKDTTGGIPRGERRIIFINSIAARYSEDTRATFNEVRPPRTLSDTGSSARTFSRFGAGAGPAENETTPAEEGPTGPGFVIRIRGRTPNSGGARFVHETFRAGLDKVRATATRPFRFVVDERRAIERLQSKDSQTPGTTYRPTRSATPRAFDAFAGGGPAGDALPASPASPSPTAAAPSASDRAGVDPLTGESTENDYAFELVFQVILGPPEGQPGQSGDAMPRE
jgi:type IV pilus assembly protein PilM